MNRNDREDMVALARRLGDIARELEDIAESLALGASRAFINRVNEEMNTIRGRTMKTLTLALVFALTASLAHAGPILDSATRQAARVELEAVQAPTQPYRKGSSRKWLEWLGIIGGGLMMATVEETCFGRFCETKWSKSVGGTGLAILAVSAISKALPDPE